MHTTITRMREIARLAIEVHRLAGRTHQSPLAALQSTLRLGVREVDSLYSFEQQVLRWNEEHADQESNLVCP